MGIIANPELNATEKVYLGQEFDEQSVTSRVKSIRRWCQGVGEVMNEPQAPHLHARETALI